MWSPQVPTHQKQHMSTSHHLGISSSRYLNISTSHHLIISSFHHLIISSFHHLISSSCHLIISSSGLNKNESKPRNWVHPWQKKTGKWLQVHQKLWPTNETETLPAPGFQGGMYLTTSDSQAQHFPIYFCHRVHTKSSSACLENLALTLEKKKPKVFQFIVGFLQETTLCFVFPLFSCQGRTHFLDPR